MRFRCSSIYYSVGRRLPNPFNSNGEQDDDGATSIDFSLFYD